MDFGNSASFFFKFLNFNVIIFRISYSKRSTNRAQTRIYWRCIDRDACNATCSTNYNVQNGIFILLGKPHTHENDNVQMKVQEVVRSIKRKAIEQPNAPPSSIFRGEIASVSNDNEIIMNLPQRQDIIRTINRVQNRHRPINPGSLEELTILAPYTHTIVGEAFLQYDSGIDDPDRFIMFYTLSSLEKLCASRMVLCDGTFKTVPSMFYQLYSLHGIVHEHTFPLIYVLTNTKNEAF